MRTILERITDTKREEIATNKKRISIEELKARPLHPRLIHSLKLNLDDPSSSGIIAEFKQKSPSKGVINAAAKVEDVTRGYARAGAAGLSVLTDFTYFGGSLGNLEKARLFNPDIPILRKDFVVDPYQLYESKASGADVILLIAACLSKDEAATLAGKAKELGLEVLFEVHDEEELALIPPDADFVGVNNRNLKTMEVSMETSLRLATRIPGQFLKISESGLSNPADIRELRTAGYQGFLIGENFMKTGDPEKACREFIKKTRESISNPVRTL
jgi:indole-3-glycerol phosphate synthase